MIWNILKQWFWCGVFHKTKLSQRVGNQVVCTVCGTEFEVRDYEKYHLGDDV